MRRPSETFLQAMSSIATMFNRDIPEEFLMSYWRGLHDLTDDEIEHAINETLATSDFLPTVAKIREKIGGTLDDQAELAFKAFSENVSYYKTLDFEDKAINATVRHLGGVARVCDMPTEGEDFNVFYRREFLKVYKIYANRDVGDDGSPLLGFYDATNRSCEHLKQISCNYKRRQLPAPQTQMLENHG